MKSAIYRIAKMFVLIWGMIASSASWAEEVSASSDAACQDSFEYMHQLARLDVSPYRAVYNEGWCEISDLQIESIIEIESVRWQISGWKQISPLELPDALNLQISGIRFFMYRMSSIGRNIDPLMDYILKVSAMADPKANVVLDFTRVGMGTSSAGHDYIVNKFKFELNPANSISFNGQLRNVNLAEVMDSVFEVTATSIDRAELEIVSHGVFERNVFPALANGLLQTSDPEAEFAMLKERTITLIQQSDDFFDASSQDALVRLIADMPHPKGRLRIEMFPENGFSLVNLERITQADDLGDVLGEANLSFSYDQTK